ncbi:MAG: Gx transporter family protein [Clostridia bacterium]
MSIKTITTDAIFIAMALAVHYLEGLLPPIIPGIPIRLGLANIFTLLALLHLKKTDAFFITLIRCTLGAVFGGSFIAILYSVAGGMFSYLGMTFLMPIYRKRTVTLIGVSVFGAFMFNLGQILIGTLFFSKVMVAYFPIMTVLSVPTGIIIGIIATIISRRLKTGILPIERS